MIYKHARYESLINKITNKDLLFIGDFTLDPYLNCEFGCKYCDSSLDETIYIKTNAAQLLEDEIGKIEKGIMIVGSVHDHIKKLIKNVGSQEVYWKLLKNMIFHATFLQNLISYSEISIFCLRLINAL